MFAPVPAPASVRDADYPFAEMVAKNVKDLMTDTGKSLYERPEPADLTQEMRDNEEVQHPTLSGLTPGLPGRPFCFNVQEKIVGLYGGGAQHARGVYHPTGRCMMRNPTVTTKASSAPSAATSGGHIDPYKHFAIDLDYEKSTRSDEQRSAAHHLEILADQRVAAEHRNRCARRCGPMSRRFAR